MMREVVEEVLVAQDVCEGNDVLEAFFFVHPLLVDFKERSHQRIFVVFFVLFGVLIFDVDIKIPV